MTSLSLLAQAGMASSIGQLVIIIIVIAAIIGIALIAVKVSGVQIPGWVTQIGWILLVAIVAILAIKFLLGWM